MKKELRFRGVTFTKEQIQAMTISEVKDLREDLLMEIESIDGQINAAKARVHEYDEYADSSWFARIRAIRGIFVRWVAICGEIIKDKNRAETYAIERYFYAEAMKALDQATFKSIEAAAKARYTEAQSAQASTATPTTA
ncbi:MAG TPA: hypothetical protein VLH56_18660 [Dissulfurispiraceae bacterium]|nr:hypothetical protein [Dissulfurispiraceae bacterium]